MKINDKTTFLQLSLPLVAILISVSVSSYWVRLVPILESPNEELHADYVFCLFSKKGLMQRTEIKTTVAHSFTKYLITATDMLMVRYNEFKKMPDGYGSNAFFAKLNSNAPAANITGCPNLISTYPVGYYALNAIWLTLVSQFDSSLTNLFFAARFFSVFLFSIGMFFSYLSLRELGLSYQRASLTILTIGLLPLVSSTSSYIQSNNLCFMAASASFFFILRWRNRGNNLSLGCLGLSLALLLLSKYQFYFCVAVSSLGLIIAKDFLVKSKAPARLRHLLMVMAPSAISAALMVWVHNGMWKYPAYLARTELAVHSGIGALNNQLVDSIANNLNSIFWYDGVCFRTFCFCFGNGETRIIIGNETLTDILRGSIQWTGIVIAICTLISLIRIWYGFVRSLSKNHARLVFFTFFSNPLINSYCIYFFGVFALAFISYGHFLLQGRHWFPLILPLFWIATKIAPRFLPNKTWRKQWFLFFVIVLLSYSAIANYFAVKSIHKRYYGQKVLPDIDVQKLIPISANASYKLELFDYINNNLTFGSHSRPLTVPPACPLLIRGWAVDITENKPASAVLVYVDGKEISATFYGLQSPTAVRDLQDTVYRNSGFGLIMPTERFSQGWHTLDIKVVSNDKKYLYGTKKSQKFFIQ